MEAGRGLHETFKIGLRTGRTRPAAHTRAFRVAADRGAASITMQRLPGRSDHRHQYGGEDQSETHQ